MSAPAQEQSGPGPVAEYGGRAGALDELLDVAGRPREAAAELAAVADLLGVPGLVARRGETARMVEDEGITYGTPSPPVPGRRGSLSAGWQLDPLPVILDRTAGQALAEAVAERAELLDLVLTDLYGPRRLLAEGLLPPEVVLAHPGFLRPADRIRVPGRHQLFLYAADLARGADGQWQVLADRTQAPSGAGYAMENRRIVSRVLPALYRDTPLERLRDFFHAMRAALQEVAPSTAEAPRVVLLSPGPGSETAFDQSFLSTLLGYPLVVGEDLTVREGRVHLRTLGRLEPVDVVLRRVDAWFADPLELRPDSRLGVPGLLEAARLGNVSVVNPFGAGVLENPGLMAFLPRVARALLGREPALASAPTWWCGAPEGLRRVRADLPRLVVKPIARGVGRGSRFGWELSARQREQLLARIEAEPGGWCVQEPVEMSTAPIVTPRGLEPRRLALRSFAVAHGGGYRVLAGGLARVAARPSSRLVSNQSGAVAKDVWVISGTPAGTPALPAPIPVQAVAAAESSVESLTAASVPPRSAENLFWLGRYAERAEDAVRLLRVVDDLAEDWTPHPGTAGREALSVLLATLTRVTTTFPGFVGDGAGERLADPHPELAELVVDPLRPGTVADAVRRTVDAAQAVREQLSLDTWVVLSSLERELAEFRARREAGTEPGLHSPLARMLESLLALSGLGGESLVRDTAWCFLDAGRRIERSLQLVGLLRHALAVRHPAGVEQLVCESVLLAGESVITYRRRHRQRPEAAGVLALLLADRGNPRALLHQLDRLRVDLGHLPDPDRTPRRPGARPLPGQLEAVVARLRGADPVAVAEPGPDGTRPALTALLDEVGGALSGLAVDLEALHFTRGRPQRAIAGTPGWDA